MKIHTVALLLLLSACAFKPMTKADWQAEAALMVLAGFDHYNSLHVARHPEDHSNIDHYSIGRHPDVDEVNRQFGGFYVLHPLITMMLEGEPRKWWQVVWIGIELNQVGGVMFHDHRENTNKFAVGLQLKY